MGKFDFSSEAAENYAQKCLCVFVLDLSGSMNEIVDSSTAVETGRTIFVDGQQYNVVEGGISKLDKLVEGLQSFYDDIADDESKSQKIEVAIITFGDKVNVVQSPALVSDIKLPELVAGGDTALVDGMYEAIDLVNKRKEWYKSTGQAYYRPWIILITDGEPSKGQDISALADKIKNETSKKEKKYSFIPIGVDNANMQVLQRIQGNIPAQKLKEAKFREFFQWLSRSMEIVVSSTGDAADNLSGDMKTWLDEFFSIE